MYSSPFSKKHQARLLGKINGKNILRRIQIEIDFSRGFKSCYYPSNAREKKSAKAAVVVVETRVFARAFVCIIYLHSRKE